MQCKHGKPTDMTRKCILNLLVAMQTMSSDAAHEVIVANLKYFNCDISILKSIHRSYNFDFATAGHHHHRHQHDDYDGSPCQKKRSPAHSRHRQTPRNPCSR